MLVQVTARVSVNDVPLKGTTYLYRAQITSSSNCACIFARKPVFWDSLYSSAVQPDIAEATQPSLLDCHC